MSSRLPVGKLPERFLRGWLGRLRLPSSVLLGPAVGEDAAALRVRSGVVVAAADPVTFAAGDIGRYALTVNANDVATRGALPKWFLATVLLPERRATPALARRVLEQLRRAAEEAGVAIVGGHTEVASGLDRPIVAGCMLGELASARLIRTSGARPGDEVLLTKGIALEAAAILAKDRPRELARRAGRATLRACLGFARDLSVVEDALTAARAAKVHAMHDPTEGGLSTGLWELAEASGIAIDVEASDIPVLPQSRAALDAFGLDPLGALASGALLIAAEPSEARKIGPALSRRGIRFATIGRARRGRGVRLIESGRSRPFPRFARDELAKLF